MNGIDSFFAVVTAVFILVTVPALYEKKALKEMINHEVRETVTEISQDPGHVMEKVSILGYNAAFHGIMLEGRANGELFPYIYYETEGQLLEDMKKTGRIDRKGRIIVYGY